MGNEIEHYVGDGDDARSGPFARILGALRKIRGGQGWQAFEPTVPMEIEAVAGTAASPAVEKSPESLLSQQLRLALDWLEGSRARFPSLARVEGLVHEGGSLDGVDDDLAIRSFRELAELLRLRGVHRLELLRWELQRLSSGAELRQALAKPAERGARSGSVGGYAKGSV